MHRGFLPFLVPIGDSNGRRAEVPEVRQPEALEKRRRKLLSAGVGVERQARTGRVRVYEPWAGWLIPPPPVWEQVGHLEASRFDNLFDRAAGVTVQQEPAIVTNSNGERRSTVFMRWTAHVSLFAVAPNLGDRRGEIADVAHHRRPRTRRDSSHRSRSGTRYRTDRPIRMKGGPLQRPSLAARRNAADISMYSAAGASFRTGLLTGVAAVLCRAMHAV